MSFSAIASAQNRCGAKTRDGGSCTQWPVKGTTRCKMHGGLAPRVQAKVRAMQLRARINGELQTLDWKLVTAREVGHGRLKMVGGPGSVLWGSRYSGG